MRRIKGNVVELFVEFVGHTARVSVFFTVFRPFFHRWLRCKSCCKEKCRKLGIKLGLCQACLRLLQSRSCKMLLVCIDRHYCTLR